MIVVHPEDDPRDDPHFPYLVVIISTADLNEEILVVAWEEVPADRVNLRRHHIHVDETTVSDAIALDARPGSTLRFRCQTRAIALPQHGCERLRAVAA